MYMYYILCVGQIIFDYPVMRDHSFCYLSLYFKSNNDFGSELVLELLNNVDSSIKDHILWKSILYFYIKKKNTLIKNMVKICILINI